jgi:squalene-hopene/tetraprenyl-beta-curcumene cyclase
LAIAGFAAAVPAADTPSPGRPTRQQWQAVVDKAVAFLKTTQVEDGSWGTAPNNRGITGIVVTGLLQTGQSPGDEPSAKGLKFIESLANPKEGHLAGDSKMGIQNYVTSINVMALSAAGRGDRYKAIIGNAADYLKRIQWDEAEKKGPADVQFGGSGYGGDGSRPDLSNTAFFLDALKAAGTPTDDPAFKRAVVFISRCQHLKSEFNDQPWAGTVNDGSFIYTPVNGGESRATANNKELIGYGSMTYAGIKSLIYCGLSKDDPRLKAAIGWTKKNYTVDANPGIPPQFAQKGLYYYYQSFAKCMTASGDEMFVDDKGVKHDWQADLFAAIAKRQKPNGSWVNDTPQWMENEPNIVTGYCLLALSYCKPK